MSKKNNNSPLIGVDTIRIGLEQSDVPTEIWYDFWNSPYNITHGADKKDKKYGKYRPRIYRSNPKTNKIFVEVSLPKLIFNNNVQEITLNHKDLVFEKLRLSLEEMGLPVSLSSLQYADLSRVDFGKNLFLQPGITTLQAIDLLHKSMILGRKQGYLVIYPNGGRELKIANKSSDLSFYDKIREIERDYYIQKDLLKKLKEDGAEILRMERRFTKAAQVKKLFEPWGIRCPKLEDVFNLLIPQSVLLKEWNDISKGFVFPEKTFPNDFFVLEELLKHGHSLINSLAYLGFQSLLQNHSSDDIRRLAKEYLEYHTVHNNCSKLQAINHKEVPRWPGCEIIVQQLQEWNAVDIPFANPFETPEEGKIIAG